MVVHTAKRLFTVEQYHQMAAAGVFPEGDRLELIEGEVVEMSPIGPRHAAAVNRANGLLSGRLGGRAIVAVQNPVGLGTLTEPLPDVALLRPRSDFYAGAHPGPEDVLLILEVAETSLAYDREVKIPLYARSGIPEVWLLDLTSETLVVFSGPSPEGFREASMRRRAETVSPLSFPDLSIEVERLLG